MAPARFVAVFAPLAAPNLGKSATNSRMRLFDESSQTRRKRGFPMNGIIYLVGLVVIVMAILSFIGLA